MNFFTDNRLLQICSFTLLIFLTACTMKQQTIGNPELPYPPTGEPEVGDIYHLPTGVKVSPEQMFAAVTDARIVYVGETHDNPASHRLQLQVLQAMIEKYPGQVSLGMEMFSTDQQEVLDQWIAGDLSEREFLKQSGWYDNWSMNYAYYSEILDYARTQRIPVVALNVPRDLVKTVSAGGFDALDDEDRALLPEFDSQDPYQRAMAAAMFAGHGQGDSMLDSFIRIQTLWDEAMATNIARHLGEQGSARRMMVMAGGNHVRYGFGIPRRAYRRLPVSYVLVGSTELVVPEDKRAEMMNVDMPNFPMVPYDYLLMAEYESLPGERVKLGVRMQEQEDGVVIEEVIPGSAAEEAGALAGDLIVSLGGAAVEDNFDLIYEVQQRSSGDRAILVVERDGERLELEVDFKSLPKPEHHQ